MPQIAPTPPGPLTHHPADVGTIRNWIVEAPPVVPTGDESAVLSDLNSSDPVTASKLRAAVQKFPAVGTDFADFHLLGALGTGTFGRVYLARQGELADRYVALKVSADLDGESQTLARLQHTNIVPIFSVHKAGPLQAVCMPSLGTHTLAHLLKKFRGTTTVPASGRQLIDTLRPGAGATDLAMPAMLGGETESGGAGFAAAEAFADPAAKRSGGVIELLRESTYPDAVCWIVSRLADGLAHAHAHGVLHNDLKPANVLITDEGQPMLLDFGVAEDWKLRSSSPGAAIGGTLPYMSPEHLESVRNRKPATDPRSDVYALGMLLYEMLTGHYAFRFPTGKFDEELPRIMAERKVAPPRLRHLNPAVSPGLEAIVRKCLEFDPARRFQKAADLRDELERHRDSQPLVHVRVPSVRERLRKWARRHPWWSSHLTLGTTAAALLALCALGLYSRNQQIARHDALNASRELTGDLRDAHYRLSTRSPEAKTLEAGVASARNALARYGLPGDAGWEQRPRFKALEPAEQAKVRDQLRDACLLLARGYAQRAKTGDESQLAEAVKLNELAERVAGDAPRAVWEQRGALLRRTGKEEAAKQADARAKDAPVVTGHDYYLTASEAVAEGRYHDAIKLFGKAAHLDPAHYWTHIGLGVCYESLALPNEAIGHYTTALALWPDSDWAYHSRGLAALRARQYDRARADFDKLAEMTPTDPEVFANRALVLQGQRKYDEAIADCNKAIELGGSKERMVLLRSRVKGLKGDKEGAKSDLAEGLKTDPTDEVGWATRGTARMDTHPAEALADFDAALAINPRSVPASQNKARALSKLGRTEDAIKVLSNILDTCPDYASGRIARGVQYARLGKAAEAVADVEFVLDKDRSAAVLYQASNVYALLAKSTPAYKSVAMGYLAAALRGGFGFDHLEADADMQPLRESAEFQRVLDAVRFLKTFTSPPAKK
jgi:serine/threonine protein kinase/tetratricopeptide (TPR) repeat protein